MKKLLLLIFSLLISTSSFAESSKFQWVDMEWTNGEWSTDNRRQISRNIFLNYVDKSSFKYNQGMVYWWSLTDYIKPTKDGFMSYKYFKEGDCKNNRFRYLSSLAYREPLATGESKYEESSDKWYIIETSPQNIMPFSELGKVCEYLSIDYYDEVNY